MAEAVNVDRSVWLRRALLGNAVFSSVSGMVFFVGAQPVSDAIGLSRPWVLAVIGLSLLVFAAGLFRNARRVDVNQLEAKTAIGMDIAWVVGTGVILAAGVLNSTGNWAAAIVADVVLVFAILQWIGLRKLAD